METIPDILVDTSAWVDINTVSGIAVGTEMQIINKSIAWVTYFEGAVAPSVDSTDGTPSTSLYESDAKVTIKVGSLKIWAKARQVGAYTSVKLNVQEL